jgi:hypothetical protein
VVKKNKKELVSINMVYDVIMLHLNEVMVVESSKYKYTTVLTNQYNENLCIYTFLKRPRLLIVEMTRETEQFLGPCACMVRCCRRGYITHHRWGLLDRSTARYFYKRLKTSLHKPRGNLLEILFSKKCAFKN